MSLISDILYALVLLIASPVILFKMATSRRWRAGLRQRHGGVPHRRGDKPCIWIHAASVGEANAIRTLVQMIEREHPDWEVRISTNTDTGQAVARGLYGAERCIYMPLDLSFITHRTLKRIRPAALVLIELELWPNLLRAAHRRGVPVVIINGRMREKRVGHYRYMNRFMRGLLAKDVPSYFCVQNEVYRDRFARAGFPAEKIRVTGTMKYDAVQMEVPAEKAAQLREALGLKPEEHVWVAGCTWPGEEEICLNVHRLLQRESPELRLVIAPRHIERSGEVAQAIERAGYKCRRRSAESGPTGAGVVCLLDTIGELGYVYFLADFAFVGKSLTERGGHNMLEPAALGVPSVFGPLTENFHDESELLLSAQAAIRVRNEQEMGEALLRMLKEPQARAEMALRGRETVLKNRGASRRNLDILRELVEKAPDREESS